MTFWQSGPVCCIILSLLSLGCLYFIPLHGGHLYFQQIMEDIFVTNISEECRSMHPSIHPSMKQNDSWRTNYINVWELQIVAVEHYFSVHIFCVKNTHSQNPEWWSFCCEGLWVTWRRTSEWQVEGPCPLHWWSGSPGGQEGTLHGDDLENTWFSRSLLARWVNRR